MSSEYPPTDLSPILTPMGRRNALRLIGVTQKQVAEEVGVNQATVSYVLDGTRGWQGTKGRLVMEHIAGKLGLPITTVFPFAERRKRPFVNPPADEGHRAA